MGAIFSGCFTVLGFFFLLAYCIQYPALFWGLTAGFIVVIILGVREGIRRSKAKTPQNSGPNWLKKPVDSQERTDEK
jgi:uncharacterized membrane protein YccC